MKKKGLERECLVSSVEWRVYYSSVIAYWGWASGLHWWLLVSMPCVYRMSRRDGTDLIALPCEIEKFLMVVMMVNCSGYIFGSKYLSGY